MRPDTTTASRMLFCTDKVFRNEDGTLKDGEEYIRLYNVYGFSELGVILRFSNGLLSDNGNEAAVEFEDTHTERWQKGKLSCRISNANGEKIPAVMANYGEIYEYWINGKRIS